MKVDPSHEEYLVKWSALYEGENYEKGLAAYFLNKSHDWCEDAFSESDYFSRVLEVGAGTGRHISSVKHRFDEYVMTDLNIPMLEKIRSGDAGGKVIAEQQDAAQLTYADNQFDRLIATHVLEHLQNPYLVLREWMRVLKPNGVLSIVLPCDPGVAWRLGRAVGSRGKFERAGIAYDYWMAREHINPINALVSYIHYYFDEYNEKWLPFRIPSMDMNLFYIVHVRKKNGAN